jgi:hypothetical protein
VAFHSRELVIVVTGRHCWDLSAWNPSLQSAHDPNIENGGGVVHSGEDEAIAERAKRDAEGRAGTRINLKLRYEFSL